MGADFCFLQFFAPPHHKTIAHKKGRCKSSGQSKTIDQEL